MIRVFLDANVYFAGTLSNQGASAFLLQLARRNKIHLVATRLVLLEADRNLRKKTSKKTVGAFHHFLRATKISVLPSPTEKIMAKYEDVIHPKDVPVLAAALEVPVDYLLTLDRKHFLTPRVISLGKKVRIMTPTDFLREFSGQKKDGSTT